MSLHPGLHWNIMIGMIKKIKNIMKRTSPIWLFDGLALFLLIFYRAGDDAIFHHRAQAVCQKKIFSKKLAACGAGDK